MDLDKESAEKLRSDLILHSNDEKAKWLEKYVKHGIKSRGVPIPKIRELLIKSVKNSEMNTNPLSRQKVFLNHLMRDIHTEDKLAAILYIQLYWENTDPLFQLKILSEWFDKKWIFDWNVCDWLCVRTLNRLVNSNTKVTFAEMKKWNISSNLWKARASIVSFIYSDSMNDHEKVIYDFSKNLIKREERFAKTGVAWILREYSKIDNKFVLNFINENIIYFTTETIKNSLKYSGKELKQDFLSRLK